MATTTQSTSRTTHLLALMKKGDDAFDLNFATTAKYDGEVMIEEFIFWDSALQAEQVGLA